MERGGTPAAHGRAPGNPLPAEAPAVIIVPLPESLDIRKNPPVAAILLVLLNCAVFLAFHFQDARLEERAGDYYLRSGLALVEVRAFEQYQAYGEVVSLSSAEATARPYPLSELYPRMARMHEDMVFMDKLEKGRVITPNLGVYPLWRDKRDRFEAILSQTTAVSWGFRPSEWRPETMLTSMFLHAGFFHLLGNMIFLWLAGCVVELAWGSAALLFIYLAGGLLSAAVFGLAHLSSTAPLVGASGAVAALMGAYAVLYGRKKMRVFYSLGFFFDYTLVPGLVILALWVANEFFQLLLDRGSGVAYLAHVGGVGGGALLGLLCRRWKGALSGAEPSPGGEDGVPRLLDRALRKVEALDMKGARAALAHVLRKEPGNRTALEQMFHLDKLEPDSVEFHDSARKLLASLTADRLAHHEARAVYREYLERTTSPKLPRGMVFSLIPFFASTGHLEEAEDIVSSLLRKSPDLPRLPESLLYLARACVKDDLRQKARSYLQVICLRYPNSRECIVARRLLEDQQI